LTSVNSTSFAVRQLSELMAMATVPVCFRLQPMDQGWGDFEREPACAPISRMDSNIDLEQGRSRGSTS
jgi:hypothetical protein